MLRKTAPHLVRVLPFLLPVFTQGRPAPRRSSRGCSARRCGRTTSPAGCGSASCTSASRRTRRSRYMPTLPRRQRRRVVHLLRRAGRRRPAHAHDRADRGRLRRRGRRTTPTLVGLDKDAAGRVHGARGRRRRRRRSRCARAVVVNATGVWSDDVRALDEGTHPTSIRPAKGVHITVPWSLVRTRSRVVIPVPKDRRSVFVVPWGGEGGDHVHLHRHHRHRLRRPARRSADARPTTSRTCSRAINGAVTTHDHRGRHPRHVGRPATARHAARAANAPPTSPAATRCARRDSGVITVTGGKLTTYRRMAADAVDAVVERARHAAAAAAPSAIRCTARAGWDATGLPSDLADALRRRRARGARALERRPGRSPSRSCPASRTRKAEVVYAARARDGAHRRRRARRAAPGPGCSRATRRPRPAPEVADADGRRARLDATPNATARSRRTERWSTRNADGRTARDRARRARSRTAVVVVPPACRRIAARRRRRSRSRATPRASATASRRRASRSTTRCRDRLAATGADVSDATPPRSARRAATGGRSR